MGMDIFGYNGNYFRANIWQWRCVIYVLETMDYDVPILWTYNDGAGLSEREDCEALAALVETFLRHWDGDYLEVPTELIAVSPETGAVVEPGTPGSVTPFRINRSHLEEFVRFLRECDGFEIH